MRSAAVASRRRCAPSAARAPGRGRANPPRSEIRSRRRAARGREREPDDVADRDGIVRRRDARLHRDLACCCCAQPRPRRGTRAPPRDERTKPRRATHRHRRRERVSRVRKNLISGSTTPPSVRTGISSIARRRSSRRRDATSSATASAKRRAHLRVARVDVERLPVSGSTNRARPMSGSSLLARIVHRHGDDVVPLREQLERLLEVGRLKIRDDEDDRLVREHLARVLERGGQVGAASHRLEREQVAHEAQRVAPSLARRHDVLDAIGEEHERRRDRCCGWPTSRARRRARSPARS